MNFYNYYNGYNRYTMLNEASLMYPGNTELVLKIGSIPMYIRKLDKVMDVEMKPIVQCVDRAIGKIISKYKFMAEYIRYSRPMYVLSDPALKTTLHKTMAVDTAGNLWLNVYFIYQELNNDTNRVFGIIFHELMHNLLNHMERGLDVFPMSSREKLARINPGMLKMEDMKQNLCCDLEVNLDMVADGVVSKEFWEEMHGMYDEKYMGKMWEEIYYKDGDKILADYLKATGKEMDEKYYEAMKAVMEALETLSDPDKTDKEKEEAATKLKDTIESLMGEKKGEKMTIRKRLKKLQKTKIKEIGEIGPYLKSVIDDLSVSPKRFTEDNLTKFQSDVDTLKAEMTKCVDEIADIFNCDLGTLEKDIEECMSSLKNGVENMTDSKLTDEQYDKIESDVIYSIDNLLADDLEKEELARKKKEMEAERKKKEAEKMEKEIEKKKKNHLLKKYYSTVDSLQTIHYHDRASATTAEGCQTIMDIVQPLLSKTIEEITADDVKGYEEAFDKLKKSLLEDLRVLKEAKIIIKRDDAYFRRITDEFYKFNVEMFNTLITPDITPTEMVGIIATAIDSIRLIGKNLHTTAKYRPSDEYRKAYKEEYDRLCKIYKELGEKGLRKELGLSAKPAKTLYSK